MRNHDGRHLVKDGAADLHTQWDIIQATGSGSEFIAEVFAGMLAGKKFPDTVMSLYRLFGGPTL